MFFTFMSGVKSGFTAQLQAGGNALVRDQTFHQKHFLEQEAPFKVLLTTSKVAGGGLYNFCRANICTMIRLICWPLFLFENDQSYLFTPTHPLNCGIVFFLKLLLLLLHDFPGSLSAAETEVKCDVRCHVLWCCVAFVVVVVFLGYSIYTSVTSFITNQLYFIQCSYLLLYLIHLQYLIITYYLLSSTFYLAFLFLFIVFTWHLHNSFVQTRMCLRSETPRYKHHLSSRGHILCAPTEEKQNTNMNICVRSGHWYLEFFM